MLGTHLTTRPIYAIILNKVIYFIADMQIFNDEKCTNGVQNYTLLNR